MHTELITVNIFFFSDSVIIGVAAGISVVVVVVVVVIIVFIYCKRRGESDRKQSVHSTKSSDNAYVSIISDLSQHMRKGYLSYRRPAKALVSLHLSAGTPKHLLFSDM